MCQIATFQTLGAKAAIRNVARVLDFPYSEADKIAKLIPNIIGISLEKSIQQEPELKKLEEEGSENEKKLISLAKKLEGLTTHLGTHAAGVIIMDTDIREVMPVCTGKDDSLQSMFTMKYAEDQGAVKFDFLGLLNLSTIDSALKLVNTQRPEEDPLDIEMIPMDDKLTFELLCRGDTTGIFQLESSGMKKLVVDMQPTLFEDIVAIVALYRPGPLGSGMVDDFIQRKHGRKNIAYSHPLMSSILQETYGVIVYQEQIMQAVQVLAGFTLGQADLLRRAIGKKIPEVLAQERQHFVQGCLNKPEFVDGASKSPKETANEIFDLIDYFSGYGFNKSHTVAYGLISYQTAYLKAHYPVEFMAALLNCSMNNPDKVVNFISECKDMGIQVLPPDVNQSVNEFTVSFLRFELTSATKKSLKTIGIPENLLNDLDSVINQKFSNEVALKSALSQLPGWEEKSEYWNTIMRLMRIDAVRFGMNAVKNVGGNAVDAILDARDKKEHKQFSDIMDFMKSVDLTKINSRMLETLIKCGAFDSLNSNRSQLFEVLEEAIHLGQEFQRAEDPSQNSLFNLLSEEDAKSTETTLQLPDTKPWNMKQQLAYEKESLGFYVSGHPLDRYESEVKKLATTTYHLQEKDYKEGDTAALAGIIISKTVRLTKNSDKFAIIKLEDLRGSIEIPIYTKLYENVKNLLDEDEPILIKGRITTTRDDEIGLTAESVEPLSHLRENTCKSITLQLSNQIIYDYNFNHLREMLLTSPGTCPVYFEIQAAEAGVVKVLLQEKITPTAKLIDQLSENFKQCHMLFNY